MKEETIYKLIGIVLILGWAIIYARKKLRTNNIFMEHSSNNYSDLIAPGPGIGTRVKMNPIITMWGCATAGIIGSVVFVLQYNAMGKVTTIFALELFVLLAVYVHMLINKSFSTTLENLQYALRVWLTTVFLSPVLTLVVIFFIARFSLPDISLPGLYLVLAILSGGFGSLTLVMLILGIHFISRTHWKVAEKREIILLLSQCMIGITILFLSIRFELGLRWLAVWLPFAAVMAWAVLYYKFEVIEMAIMVDDDEMAS